MRKRMLMALTLALLICTVFIFSSAPSASAASSTGVAPQSLGSDVFCHYVVTATAGLHVRSGPSTSYGIVYTLSYNQVVLAYRDNLASGSGYTWRQLADGNWAVTTWLSRTGTCIF